MTTAAVRIRDAREGIDGEFREVFISAETGLTAAQYVLPGTQQNPWVQAGGAGRDRRRPPRSCVAVNLPTPPRIAPVPQGEGRPFWSVMIPTYNCDALLEQALRSVLDQDPGPTGCRSPSSTMARRAGSMKT